MIYSCLTQTINNIDRVKDFAAYFRRYCQPKSMTPSEIKKQLENAIKLSASTNTIRKLTVSGYGCFRIDGNYVVLIKEDGSYQRITPTDYNLREQIIQ